MVIMDYLFKDVIFKVIITITSKVVTYRLLYYFI